MLTAVLLALAAPPTDVVQTHDLGTIPWRRARGLDGQRVRVRFTVDRVSVAGKPDTGEVVLAVVRRPPGEWRYVTLAEGDLAALSQGARLEAEGVLQVTWDPTWPGDSGLFIVSLKNARLVK
jgi:hypothetical protein